jgi:hypothetical protein
MVMTQRLGTWCTAASLVLLLAPATALAQLNCMVPTRERGDGGARANASRAAFRNRVLAIERIVKENQHFMTGIRPIRVRTTIDYGDVQPRTAIVNTVAYNREAWLAKGCDVIPQADRGGGVSDGAVHVTVNDPRTFFGGSDNDGVLETFTEPVRSGEFGGFPEFNGMYVLLARPGFVPWVPVTIADVLDREGRRLERDLEEWSRDKQRPGMNEADIDKSYALLRQLDPKAAEEQRAAMIKVMHEARAQRVKFEAEQDADLARRRVELDAYRRSFTPERLASQATVGHFPDGRVKVDDQKGRKLVKVDPAVARLNPDAIHFMRVFVGGVATDPVPGRWPWMQRTKAAVDLAGLARLIE